MWDKLSVSKGIGVRVSVCQKCYCQSFVSHIPSSIVKNIAVLRELYKKEKKTQVSKEKPFKLGDYWKSNLPISKIEITSNFLK